VSYLLMLVSVLMAPIFSTMILTAPSQPMKMCA
jgi:hypothetical protein